MLHSRHSLYFPVPEDLSFDERDELSNIRRRKKELLDDIEVSVTVQFYRLVLIVPAAQEYHM